MIAKLRSASFHGLKKVKQLFESQVFGIAQNNCLDRLTIYHGKKSEAVRRIGTCNEHNSLPTQQIIKDATLFAIDIWKGV